MLIEHCPDVSVEFEEYQEHFQANIDLKQRLIGKYFKEITHSEVIREVAKVIAVNTPVVLLFSILSNFVDFKVLVASKLDKVIGKALESVFRATKVIVSKD